MEEAEDAGRREEPGGRAAAPSPPPLGASLSSTPLRAFVPDVAESPGTAGLQRPLEDKAGRSSQLQGRESGGKASRKVVLPEHPKAAAHLEREDLPVPLWTVPEILKSHHTLSLGSDKLQKCPLCLLTKPPGQDAGKVLMKKHRGNWSPLTLS